MATKKNKKNLLHDFIMAYTKEEKKFEYKIGDEIITINVRPVISLENRMMMINEIFDGVVGNNAISIEDYTPQYAVFIKKMVAINYFTDYKLPKGLDEAWAVINYTPIFRDVDSVVGEDLRYIFEDADRLIESRVRFLENKTTINKLLDKISKAFDKITGLFDGEDIDIKKLLDGVKGLSGSGLEELVKKLTDGADLQASINKNNKE